MSRRASLPGASELFRRTGDRDGTVVGSPNAEPTGRRVASAGVRRGSGRQKHDSKITVYLSGEELLALEHARLELRGTHDLVVDRGRLVREAVAVLLADFDERGPESVLVRRLRGEGDPGDGEDAGGDLPG